MRSFNSEQVERSIVSTSAQEANVAPPEIDSQLIVKPLKSNEKVRISVNHKNGQKGTEHADKGVEQVEG